MIEVTVRASRKPNKANDINMETKKNEEEGIQKKGGDIAKPTSSQRAGVPPQLLKPHHSLRSRGNQREWGRRPKKYYLHFVEIWWMHPWL
jgi:hypothetical protein